MLGSDVTYEGLTFAVVVVVVVVVVDGVAVDGRREAVVVVRRRRALHFHRHHRIGQYLSLVAEDAAAYFDTSRTGQGVADAGMDRPGTAIVRRLRSRPASQRQPQTSHFLAAAPWGYHRQQLVWNLGRVLVPEGESIVSLLLLYCSKNYAQRTHQSESSSPLERPSLVPGLVD